ncbi:MAG: hypothetical protein ABJO30_01840 [Hyphomicrobiales bacterium]
MATTRNTKRTATTVALLIMLGVMSACSSSGLSLVPASLRASITAEDAKDKKVSVNDILTSAREEEEDNGGQTIVAKTRGKFASIFKRKKKNPSPVFQPVETASLNLKTDKDAIAAFLEEQTAEPNTVLAKTSSVDTISTASVSTVKKSKAQTDPSASRFAKQADAIREKFDNASEQPVRKTKTKTRNNLRVTSNNQRAGDGGLTNAEIAKGWVETGPDDLAGLPIDGFDDDFGNNGAETEAVLRGDASADVRFSQYLNKTRSRISNERDYERQLQEASREATYEQDASTVFKAAQRIAKQNPQSVATQPRIDTPKIDPSEVLARSKALNARNKANSTRATTEKASNNALLERARALVSRTQPATPTTTTLVLASGATNLSASQRDQFSQFLAAHKGKPLKIEAGLGNEGNTFERLAKAQARLKSLANQSPAIRAADQQIKPELQPNTIRLSVKS